MVKLESWSKVVFNFWAKQMLDMSCMEAPWGFLFGLVLVTLIDCYWHNFLVCTPGVLMMAGGRLRAADDGFGGWGGVGWGGGGALD